MRAKQWLRKRSASDRSLLAGATGTLFLVAFSAALLAQIGTSGITGTVTDPSGAVVPNVKIAVQNESTNVIWNTTSSGSGAYMIRNLPPGSYTVTAVVAGFEKSITRHIVADVDRISTVNVRLAVGAPSQSVTVQSTPSVMLNTQSGTVGQLVDSKEAETLPLNGRNWIELMYLTPGAVTFHGLTASQDVMGTSSVMPQGIVVNGLRGGDDTYYLDGSETKQEETQDVLIMPAMDALSQFRVQTSNYTAEYPGSGGGAVSAATKSGTDTIHGDVWEFVRNDAFDSRTFFDSSIPPLRRNQFGFVLGGPIQKDRTFFFGGYEGFRQVEGTTIVDSYPTTAMRSGDLSSVSTQLINPLTGAPFINNQVPVSPLSAKWLNDWIPLPNTNVPLSEGNFRTAPTVPINYNSFVGRIDHTVSDKTSFFGRYYGSWINGATAEVPVEFTRPLIDRGQNYVFEATRSFTPTTVGQFRFSYNRTFESQSVNNTKRADMLTELGIAPGAVGFSTNPNSDLAPPDIGVTGFGPFGGSLFGRPREWYGDSYYYDVLFFLNRGSHNMSLGGDVGRQFLNFPEVIIPTGSFSYTGDFTGYGLGDFLLGYPTGVFGLPDPFHQDLWRWQPDVWFQDNWRATQKLTLNLGLRWDDDNRYISSSGTVANWNLSTLPIATEFFPKAHPDSPGCPVSGCSPVAPLTANWKGDWSPRFGFAYRARRSLVVRGGYGIYYQTPTSDPFVNLSLQGPFVNSYGASYVVSELPQFVRSNPLGASEAVTLGADTLNRNLKDGYEQEWNLTAEKSIGANLISAAYVGSKGSDLYTFESLNVPPPGPGPLQPRRPYQNLGAFTYQDSSTDANYNALQLRGERRVAKGLTFTASYAWEKAIDTSDGTYIEGQGDTYQQPLNHAAERSLAEYNETNALTFSYIYELPFGHGQTFLNAISPTANELIGGWQVQGITTIASGPWQSFVTNGWDNLNDGGTSYPDRVCNPNLGGGRSNAQKSAMFFNTACFVAPSGGTPVAPSYVYGNSTRHPLADPGDEEWDFAIQKAFGIGEKAQLQFRAETFNLFNRPNFGLPNTSFGTPEFGTITSANPGREIQFGLRLIF